MSDIDKTVRSQLVKLTQLRSYPAQFETRGLANGRVEVTGYASTVNRAYSMRDSLGEYKETVRSGAFAKTLSEGADVSFLINHGGMTVARTKGGSLTLSEDSHGLLSTATVNATRSDVRDMLTAIEDGILTEMSFGFRVMQQKWDDAYENRELIELNLDRGDVSVVNYGANPNTSIMATQRALASIPAGRALKMQTELRQGAQLSDATMQTLSQVLQCIADADICLDQAQPLLASVLGVPNPDHKPGKDGGYNNIVQPTPAPNQEHYAAKDPKKPYGDVAYGDPGYLDDGVSRYPIDTEAHVHAALSYIAQSKNASQYTASQLSKIKGRINAAAKKFGIQVEGQNSDDAYLQLVRMREMLDLT